MNTATFRGEKLRRRREERGLTVDDVYRKLRIPSDCVLCFESGRLEHLPVETYAVGFLRTYCEFLEMDPDPWIGALREFQVTCGSASGRNVRNFELSQRPWIREAVAWASVSIVLALGWLTYAVVVQPTSDDSAKQVQAETREMQPPSLPQPRR